MRAIIKLAIVLFHFYPFSRIQDQLRRLKKIEEKEKRKAEKLPKPKPLTTIKVTHTHQPLSLVICPLMCADEVQCLWAEGPHEDQQELSHVQEQPD